MKDNQKEEKDGMNQDYNKVNAKLLSILAYIGPLFIMGKVAVEKDEPGVKFHCRQGGILFAFVAVGYLAVSYTHLPGIRCFLPWIAGGCRKYKILLKHFPMIESVLSLPQKIIMKCCPKMRIRGKLYKN